MAQKSCKYLSVEGEAPSCDITGRADIVRYACNYPVGELKLPISFKRALVRKSDCNLCKCFTEGID